MKKQEFEREVNMLKVGVHIKVYVRGNYQNYFHEGKFVKAEDNYLYLDNGKAHARQRILAISP